MTTQASPQNIQTIHDATIFALREASLRARSKTSITIPDEFYKPQDVTDGPNLFNLEGSLDRGEEVEFCLFASPQRKMTLTGVVVQLTRCRLQKIVKPSDLKTYGRDHCAWDDNVIDDWKSVQNLSYGQKVPLSFDLLFLPRLIIGEGVTVLPYLYTHSIVYIYSYRHLDRKGIGIWFLWDPEDII